MSGDVVLPTPAEISEINGWAGIVKSRVGRLRPDGSFDVWSERETHNIQTDHGDQVFANLVGQVSGATAVTGFRLGIGTATPTKLSTGAAIGSYLNLSSKALDDLGQGVGKPGVPTQIGSGGSGWSIPYQVTWAAGTCPSHVITEVVMTDVAIANSAGTVGNTVARATFGPDDNQPGGVDADYQIIWYKISLG